MRNADFHTLDVKLCCERKLAINFRSGAEYNGWYMLEGRKIARITIPQGRKPIPRKTYKSMATQLKLTVDQFDRLMDCPLDGQTYRKLIEQQL